MLQNILADLLAEAASDNASESERMAIKRQLDEAVYRIARNPHLDTHGLAVLLNELWDQTIEGDEKRGIAEGYRNLVYHFPSFVLWCCEPEDGNLVAKVDWILYATLLSRVAKK